MPDRVNKLAVIGLQQTFLQMVYDQLTDLADGNFRVRTVSLNELDETPLEEKETILYFSNGLKAIVERMFPRNRHYIYAKRENLILNMRELFDLAPGQRILVVNDVRKNTDEMTRDLQSLGLGHTFFPYYPSEPLPPDIHRVVTAGERMLVPPQLKEIPIIDIGLRFISLESIYALFDHFNIAYTHAALARKYMRTAMMLSDKWPVLGEERFRPPHWFGIRRDTSAPITFADLVRNSAAMAACCREAEKMAQTDTPIHLYGEIGTGKTKLAQAIHNASAFGEGPFIAINCAARPPEILERELFGWEKGTATYKSLFESAENGTLCIEEIGKLPRTLQARLLQAVTEKRIIRSNGSGVVDIHVRLITTSSRPLDQADPGSFDPVLMMMLTQHTSRVPALRDRVADLETLVDHYIRNQLRKPHLAVPPETLGTLKAYQWNGNVQELYHVLQHAVCMSGDTLERKNLPYYLTNAAPSPGKNGGQGAKADQETDFSSITRTLVTHGFLDESRAILKIYKAGKEKHKAYGRNAVQAMLQDKGFALSRQQLRLKLERMDKLGLLIVRPGRGGTTISEKGEHYLKNLSQTQTQTSQ